VLTKEECEVKLIDCRYTGKEARETLPLFLFIVPFIFSALETPPDVLLKNLLQLWIIMVNFILGSLYERMTLVFSGTISSLDYEFIPKKYSSGLTTIPWH